MSNQEFETKCQTRTKALNRALHNGNPATIQMAAQTALNFFESTGVWPADCDKYEQAKHTVVLDCAESDRVQVA